MNAPSASVADDDTAQRHPHEGNPAEPDELEAQVYVPFKAWVDAVPGRSILVAATVLMALQLLVRSYVKFGNWFIADDLAFIGRAQTMPFWSSQYLFAGWNGHFMPGAFVEVRVLNALWPMNYLPVGLVDLGLQLLVDVLVYRLLVALFGRRPAILVPLAVYLFSPMTLPAFAWWAAALNQLPGQAALAGVLLAQVRYHRSGRLRYGLLGAVTALAGLMFSEKVLLAVPCVLALTLFYFTDGEPLHRTRSALVRHWRVWAAYLCVVAPYAVFYAIHVPSPVGRPSNLSLTLDTVGTSLTHAVLPALFGGPWNWTPIGLIAGVGGIAEPGAALVPVTIVSALIVWWSILRRRRAVFAWVIILGYEGVNAVLLGLTRATWVGPFIGAEYRYSTDACIVFVVFGSMAFLQTQGRFVHPAQRLVPRNWLSGQGAGKGGRWPVSFGAGQVEVATAGTLVCMLVVSGLISTMRYDSTWRLSTIRNYFDVARSDVAAKSHPITISDGAVPENIESALFGKWAFTSNLMAGFTPKPSFLTRGASTDRLYTFDNAGHLHEATVDGFRNKPGPEPRCGWRVSQAARTVPLQLTTMPWLWTARIGYIASEDAQTTVTVGAVTSRVTIKAGLHALFVMGEGAIDTVSFTGLTNGALCTDDIAVGFVKALPDPQQ